MSRHRVLRSSKTIRKEMVQGTLCLRRASPHPGLGSMVELSRGDSGGLLNLSGIGKTLASEGIAAEETPPALLQIEPACSCGKKDVMQTGMLSHPGAGLSAVVAGEIVCDKENVASGIIRFDALKQRNVIRRVA